MNQAIIIGDSTHNTLSVIRSLGVARLPFTLILKCEDDTCNVAKSKYIRPNRLERVQDMDSCQKILDDLDSGILICTFDEAAEWIDAREPELSKKFITPCRGRQIGNLFNKDVQCELARECGLTVPKSVLFRREKAAGPLPVPYPVILKPLYSTKGEKSDIHICRNKTELHAALSVNSSCEDFILQEFIDKEYELNCLGVSCDAEIIIPGGIVKKRHYPLITGACSFGVYNLAGTLSVNYESIKEFIRKSGYHGPFSVEFLHAKDGKDYFMEVNFRNDGLAQTATDAGANLHAMYIDPTMNFVPARMKRIYMMNYSIDYLHVSDGRMKKLQWWRDFFRSRCFINASFHDPMPVLNHYLSKLHL